MHLHANFLQDEFPRETRQVLLKIGSHFSRILLRVLVLVYVLSAWWIHVPLE